MTTPTTLTGSGGKVLKATPVLDTYWRFAAARQQVFHKRVAGEPPPWTDDPVLAGHRFTNAYRASDRVSQYLIRHVQYEGSRAPEEVFFRTLLFKIFNRIETWESLVESVGTPSCRSFDVKRYGSVLDSLMTRRSIYSAAYIMPSPPFGATRKHGNHLALLERMLRDRLPTRICEATCLAEVYNALLEYPSMGRFLAYQFTVDLNYSEICNFSENEFVVAGPGARDGIRKCFSDTAGYSDEDVIRIVTENGAQEFARIGLDFRDLWGRQLHLIDCQNLFCEVDKYSRVVHPEYSGLTGRTRIKQRFEAKVREVPQWYPPKWKLLLPARLARLARTPQPASEPKQLECFV